MPYPDSKFKVGDEIEIVGPRTNYTNILWSTNFEHYIGQKSKIQSVTPWLKFPGKYLYKIFGWLFPEENLKLIENSEVVTKYPLEAGRKLKLKSSGLVITIIESKGNQVRFRTSTNVESGWCIKEQLDKECIPNL
ncbi:MAG TPA: hypothetical protein VNX68_16095 [Nitrosopumilaceae archaeon]|jgi:hypothetical protein|nr:hypothetical protein [Nitrosopumilaceae archaeon]